MIFNEHVELGKRAADDEKEEDRTDDGEDWDDDDWDDDDWDDDEDDDDDGDEDNGKEDDEILSAACSWRDWGSREDLPRVMGTARR